MLRNHMAIFIMYSYCCWLQEGKLATGILTPLVKNAGFGNVSDFLDKGTDDIAKVLQWKSPDAAEAVRPRCVWKCLCACNVCVCLCTLKAWFSKAGKLISKRRTCLKPANVVCVCVCVCMWAWCVYCVWKNKYLCAKYFTYESLWPFLNAARQNNFPLPGLYHAHVAKPQRAKTNLSSVCDASTLVLSDLHAVSWNRW